MTAEIERFRWIEGRPDLLDAVSLTFVQPVGEAWSDVLTPRRMLPTLLPYVAALAAAFELDDYPWGSLVVQIDELDGWTTIIEPCGWACAVPDVVARLSTAGVAVNVFWNVNAQMSACVGRLGSVVRHFDPLLYELADDHLPEELDLPFGDPAAPLAAVSLAFQARITGVAFDEHWLLDLPRRTFVVPMPATG